MAKPIDPGSKFNFSTAAVLILDRSTHCADVTAQIFSGFGVHKLHRCQTAANAMKILAVNNIDLLIVDPELEAEDGFEFIRELRRSSFDSRFAPVILLSGHAKLSSIKRGRDTGANFFIAKPITPALLMQRIYWIAADKRQFVDVNFGSYVGPDRRFKFEGPPMGSDGRRESDLPVELGEPTGKNLSQTEIGAMFKPQRVVI